LRIEWHPAALKELGTLDEPVQRRIAAVLKDPQALAPRLQPLSADLARLRKVRVGDYRLLCSVDQISARLTILVVSHRSQAYSKRSREAALRRAQWNDAS